jgi:hypothetical protein
MAVIPRVLVPPLQLATAATTQYTAPAGTRTIIDKATVTNTDTSNRSFSVNLVTSGGSAGNANLVIDTRTVVPDETYLCPELIGQILEPGSFISTTASAATALTLRISGREVT